MNRPPMPGDAFDNNFDGTSDRPIAKALSWLAHQLGILIPIAVIFRVATYFAYDSVPAQVADAVCSIALVLVFFVALFHQEAARLCVRCMQEVPENAPELAERRRTLLWFEHRHEVMGLWAFVPLLVVITISIVGSYSDSTPVRVLTTLPNDGYLFAMVYGMWIHHRLKPWCPYCGDQWGDGGEHELIPDPDPAEGKRL